MSRTFFWLQWGPRCRILSASLCLASGLQYVTRYRGQPWSWCGPGVCSKKLRPTGHRLGKRARSLRKPRPFCSRLPTKLLYDLSGTNQLKPFCLALLQSASFDYPPSSEIEYDSLEAPRGFSSQPGYESEGPAGPVFRHDGYDPLPHPPFQHVSLRPSNGFDYRAVTANQGRHDGA